ncbi:MAG: hypothetical protein RR211_03405 [Pseudoflavonifractor sp.]
MQVNLSRGALRRFRGRIRRIAAHKKAMTAGLVAVMAAVCLLGGCTLTGGKIEGPRTLDGAELTYFNEEFFNGDGFHLSNQFLSSRYESPKDMDLYELFYSYPAAAPSDEELMLAFGGTQLECAAYKLTAAELDEQLVQFTGLHLAETQKLGLERFTCLQDAYFWAHGDSNYRGRVDMTAGEQEGDKIRLYYNDAYLGTGWTCVTLQAVEGGYYFVSNLPAEKPALPTVLPKGKPELTIALDGLAPYEIAPVTVTRHRDDCAERLDAYALGDYIFRTYRSTDGQAYAAIIYDEAAGPDGMAVWDAGCFFTLPDPETTEISFFNDLFGRDGIAISYRGESADINDYYYLSEDGNPVLLARAYGEAQIFDVDGDGENELASDTQLFFGRDGKIYEANLPNLLKSDGSEELNRDHAIWDKNHRSLAITGLIPAPGGTDSSAKLSLYFDGEKLLVYKNSAAE